MPQLNCYFRRTFDVWRSDSAKGDDTNTRKMKNKELNSNKSGNLGANMYSEEARRQSSGLGNHKKVWFEGGQKSPEKEEMGIE